jgi:hypothetical protein
MGSDGRHDASKHSLAIFVRLHCAPPVHLPGHVGIHKFLLNRQDRILVHERVGPDSFPRPV